MTQEVERLLSGLDRVVTAELMELRPEELTPEAIRRTISDVQVMPKYREISETQAEDLARHLESRHEVRLSIGGVVQLEHEPWLPSSKAAINPYYWGKYKRLLSSKGLSNQVLAALDEVSDRTLGLLGNPGQDGKWDRRGLVLGNVQSGKTANYLGLMCKAADAGYRVIIVIAGIHNNLRNQTQSRVDEGFIGYEKGTAKNKVGKVVGVGRYDLLRRPSHFTSSTRDFHQQAAEQVGVPLQNLSEPAVFVIKKNAHTLRNLIEWLQTSVQGGRINSPLLVVDDEADNASINVTQGQGAASRINHQIRDVLQMFNRSSYVGYTATPFANIFIDPDSDDDMIGQDLFPRDFIVSLDAPTNYLGAQRVFLESPDLFLRSVEDAEDVLPLRHRIDLEVGELPESLHEAVRAFLIACAIRRLRGQHREHNSMLVNASRFTRVQAQLRNELHAYVDDIRNALRVNGALPANEAERDTHVAALHRTWETVYSTSGSEWRAVLTELYEAVAPVNVVEVNSRSAGALNYRDFDDGLNVIAVGGFSLSRGLTLEGLTVTYFLRNSMMYDTLMQMGRWFGYRPGYEDLCRVWMPEEAQGWYGHIAESIEILREDLKHMEAAGATPAEFGLRVRSHPDALIVTARNKMGTGQRFEVSVGLGGSLIETTPVSIPQAASNVKEVGALVERLQCGSVPVPTGSGHLFVDVPVAEVLSFVRAYKGDPGSTKTQSGPVLEYIRERSESTLALWDVLLVSSGVRDGIPVEVGGLEVVYPFRTAGERTEGASLHIGNNQKVSSRGVEKAGLSDGDIRQAEEEYKQRHPQSKNIPDHAYRRFRTKPLLILQLLNMKPPKEKPEVLVPELVAAWGMSFPFPLPPPSPPEKRVTFVVNTVWFEEHFGVDSDDEGDGDD